MILYIAVSILTSGVTYMILQQCQLRSRCRATVTATFFLAYLLTAQLDMLIGTWIPIAILSVLGAVGWRFLMKRRRELYLRRIEHDLPEAIDTLVTALKAGLPLITGLDTMRHTYPGPLAQEMTVVLRQYKLGSPLTDCLKDLKAKIASESVVMFCTALTLGQRLGGNITEVLGRLSLTLREKQRVGRKLRALTAQGRAQALILCLTPPALFLATAWMDSAKLQLFTSTPMGQLLLGAAAALEALGIYATRQIMRIII